LFSFFFLLKVQYSAEQRYKIILSRNNLPAALGANQIVASSKNIIFVWIKNIISNDKRRIFGHGGQSIRGNRIPSKQRIISMITKNPLTKYGRIWDACIWKIS
jgi:hypothetical protein